MAPKKRVSLDKKPLRTVVEGSGASPSADPPEPRIQEQSSVNDFNSAYASIKQECMAAIIPIQSKNFSKALRNMKEILLRHNCGFAHRMVADVHWEAASEIAATNLKRRHLKDAIDSARRALDLMPNSIEFAHFYSKLLLQQANDIASYQEVVIECKRALSIEDPNDPLIDSIVIAGFSALTTPKERIAVLRTDLMKMAQTSGNAIEELRDEEEEESSEKPESLAVILPEPRKVINLSLKAYEDWINEIEDKNLFQRRLENFDYDYVDEGEEEEDDDDKDWVADVKPEDLRLSEKKNVITENSKMSERKKQALLANIMLGARKKGQLRTYWNSISEEKKRGHIEIRIADLRDHFLRSFKDGLAEKVFSEAVSFARKSKTWKFSPCCICDEEFGEVGLLLRHVEEVHKKRMTHFLGFLLQREVDADWADLLVNGKWKPVDTPRAIEIIRKQSKSELRNLFDEEDTDKISCQEPNKEDSENSETNDLAQLKGNSLPKASLENQNWPLSDDIDRARILEEIHAQFQLLLSQKCLTTRNLSKVIKYTLKQLQNFVPASELSSNRLDQTPLCICFLGMSRLKSILDFLKSWCHLECDPSDDSSSNEFETTKIDQGIVFTGDEHFLRVEFMPHRYCDAATTCTARDDEVYALPDNDAFINWLFGDPSVTIGEELAAWATVKGNMKPCGYGFLRAVDKQHKLYRSLTKVRRELLLQNKACETMERVIDTELQMREQDTNHVPETYASLFLPEELVGVKILESHLDAVASVLEEAQALNLTEFDIQGASEHMDEEYVRIKIAIVRQREKLCIELDKINGQLENGNLLLRKFGETYRKVSTLDYRDIMLKLLMVFIQGQIECLINEEAKQKSEAARQAILLELEVDAKKNTNKSVSPAKDQKEKSKAKTRNKAKRKAQASKATCGDELTVAQQLSTEISGDELKLQEEELERKIQMEEEERKPVEILEHQKLVKDADKKQNLSRQTENEAAFIRLQEEKLYFKIEIEEEDRKLEEMLERQKLFEDEAKQQNLARQTENEAASITLQDEEIKHKIEMEEDERKVQEMLEFQKLFEDEAKQQNLAGQTENEAESITEMLEKKVDVCRTLSDEKDIAASHHQVLAQQIENEPASITELLEKKVDVCSALSDGKDMVASHNQAPQLVHNQNINDEDKQMTPAEQTENEAAHILEKMEKKADIFSTPSDEKDIGASHHQVPQLVHNKNIDYEAKQMNLAELTENEAASIPEKLEKKADFRSTLGDEKDIGASHHQDVGSVLLNLRPGITASSSEMPHRDLSLGDDAGEYNCFLNVIVQSLWHLRKFRDEVLSRSVHVHFGDPCVVCALQEVFTALSEASENTQGEAISTMSLRTALSKLNFERNLGRNLFREGQMSDASEVLSIIFGCLHESYTSDYDCDACLGHRIFGIDIFEKMICSKCGIESWKTKFTCFVYELNASSLRTVKVMHAETPFDELFKLGITSNYQSTCDFKVGGCGTRNSCQHIICAHPQVFTLVLGWKSANESEEDILATMNSLTTKIDIGVMFDGLHPGILHSLVSIVCYYGRQFLCLAYSSEEQKWFMNDDKTVMDIGSWDDVISMCECVRLQPQVLFFEAPK